MHTYIYRYIPTQLFLYAFLAGLGQVEVAAGSEESRVPSSSSSDPT